MSEKTINSRFLNEEIQIKIYKPESLDLMYQTNVCIMQDGNDYFNMGRVATLSDKLHSEFDIVNTIFIGIHYNDRYDRREKYHPKGNMHTAYKQFLIDEVIPVISEELPLNPLGESWALMGDSLAGTLAFLVAIEYLDFFDKVIMQSPLVNKDVLNVADKLPNKADLEIYHTIGLNETNVPTTSDGELDFIKPNKELYEILKAKKIVYHYFELENGIHTWKYWQQDLNRALTSIFN